MSRQGKRLNKYVSIIYGNDHAIGAFIDVQDNRFVDDEQGEGYVCEWSNLFGLSNNRIGATMNDLRDYDKIVELCNEMVERNFKFKRNE